ncbi:MAG TPA: hypothetical protein PKC70_08855, partial [Cellvibrionaceae bacterium]|nr:hypothetical protein [Cellvibrionaceae bacterium]
MFITRIGLACAGILVCASVMGQSPADASGPAGAEVAAQVGGTLSLRQALAATLAHNPELAG